MLPNKQYFHISAIVSGTYLHETMRYLEQKKVYNLEVKVFREDHEYTEESNKRSGKRRDRTEVRNAIVALLTKNGPTRASDILKEIGAPRDFGLLGRMASEKLIKKTTKKGVYKV